MTRILRSVFAIAIVAVLAVGVSRAAYSDTEKSTNAGFETGTIDIAVDGENPWESTGEYTLEDMKPSFTGYVEFKITNVGTNPANVWKTLSNYQFSDLLKSEPECDAEGGDWVGNRCTGGQPDIMDFASTMNYDMRVELYPPQADEAVWWETIYTDSDNVTLDSLKNQKMYLGMIPVGWSMKVVQSYHMPDSEQVEQNQFQGDKMTYDITLYAEELTNTVRLVNKLEANGDVSHNNWNYKYADFSYKVMDDKLRWNLATTNVPGGEYTLIAWDDSNTTGDPTEYNWAWSERSEAIVLGHITVPGGSPYSGEVDLNYDLTNTKVWLVPGNFGGLNPGDSAGDVPWESDTTFFETGLVDYYDSLLP